MKHDIYTKFGTCWNAADFAPFESKLKKDCTYVSYDYFYKLKGRARLTEFFNGQAKENLNKSGGEKIDIHRGYYQKTNSVLKTIKECCIMVRRQDLATVNILAINKRLGKVSSIVGMDPEEVKSIRDIKI
jgi:hypothetical protein